MTESQHPWSATSAGCPLVTEVVTEVAVTSGRLVVVTVLKSTSDAMLVVGGEDGGDIIWRGNSVLLRTNLLPLLPSHVKAMQDFEVVGCEL